MKKNRKYKLSHNRKNGRLIHFLLIVFLFSLILIMLCINSNLILSIAYITILTCLLLFGSIYIYYNCFDWNVYLLDGGYKIKITRGKQSYIFNLTEDINFNIKSYGLRTVYFQVFKFKIENKTFHVKFKPVKIAITLNTYSSFVEKVERNIKSEVSKHRNIYIVGSDGNG
jgi:hypothetical protein